MAIDTANKRRSASGAIGPVADGSLALAADRRHVVGFYRFADVVDPPPPPLDGTPLPPSPRRGRQVRRRKFKSG